MNPASDAMRVLVADDEASIRFVLQEVLEGLGHEVVAVEDGEAAARELASDTYDLAFMDIRMPGMTGIEALQQHRAAGGDVAIVETVKFHAEFLHELEGHAGAVLGIGHG